jgi:DNA modification methylase
VGKIKFDVPIIDNWLGEIEKISKDICSVNSKIFPTAEIFLADARDLRFIQDNSIDAVITSPPYPNEKDYTRTTRLESVLLGFINNKEDLRNLKKRLVRSNTRGVYKGDNDDQWVLGFPEIQSIAEEIENRRIELGKDSGFERMYGKVTRLYFGGMAKHLAELRRILRPGAQLAYVVGDQASYLRIMIRTGKLLADIATSLGYELVDIDLFRTRMATATKEQLREEVVLLRWNG